MQQQRRDEILAKKAKLAELKRQRELRATQATATRQSIGGSADVGALLTSRNQNRLLTAVCSWSRLLPEGLIIAAKSRR